MADNGGFLGGSPQFNKVGEPAPVDSNDLAARETPQSLQPYQVRNILIVLAVLVMLIILFFISDPGGVIHKDGGGGRTLQAPPTAPKGF